MIIKICKECKKEFKWNKSHGHGIFCLRKCADKNRKPPLWMKGTRKDYSKNGRPKGSKDKSINAHLNRRNSNLGTHHSEETIRKILKRLSQRPTSLEKRFIEIIKDKNLPYKYVGDGSFIIGYKNPDFVNIDGKKICMEVANRFHHQGDWKEKRIEHFAKYGWKCLVLFEDEIDNIVEDFFNLEE